MHQSHAIHARFAHRPCAARPNDARHAAAVTRRSRPNRRRDARPHVVRRRGRHQRYRRRTAATMHSHRGRIHCVAVCVRCPSEDFVGSVSWRDACGWCGCISRTSTLGLAASTQSCQEQSCSSSGRFQHHSDGHSSPLSSSSASASVEVVGAGQESVREGARRAWGGGGGWEGGWCGQSAGDARGRAALCEGRKGHVAAGGGVAWVHGEW